MKHRISIEIDEDALRNYTDEYIANLWHVAQANPAPFGDPNAARLAETLGLEIIRRWLKANPGDMYCHLGSHLHSSDIPSNKG